MADENDKPAETPAPAPAAGGDAKPAAEKPAAAAKPAAPPAPKGFSGEDASSDPVVVALAAAVPGAVTASRTLVGELTIELDRGKLLDSCRHLKASGFTMLVELFGADFQNWKGWPGERFGVAWILYSFEANRRIRLRVGVADGVAVPSVVPIWRTADWFEREAWDMYGIPFEGRAKTERILTWEGFNGHPLRKDFPVEGLDTGAAIYPEVWPAGGGPPEKDTNKKVVS